MADRAGMKRLRLVVAGRVQGVFFRAATREVAERLGLVGWVRNLADGRVERVAEGPADALLELKAWCRQGPPLARVASCEVTEEPPAGAFTRFRVERDG